VANTASTFKFEDRNEVILARRRHFETVFILNPGMDEKAVEEVIEKNALLVANTEGSLLRQDDWGKLRMAYDIEKHAQGRYFYFRYIGAATTVKALERSLRLDANCMRFQTVRLSENLSTKEIDELMQKAPHEKSTSPTTQNDDQSHFEFMS
jgi:small subunit ribosomal protein S6